MFLFATTALLMHVAEGSRVLRADATAAVAVYTVWSDDDVCSQPMQQPNNCTLDVTCSACLTRPGCAVESTTGKCVSISRINTTVSNAVEYFRTGQNQYCDSSDDACSSCGASNGSASANAVCRGAGGCVCVYQCELAEANAQPCKFSQISFSWFYVIIAVSVAFTGAIMARMYRVLATGLTASFERRVRTRRVHKENPLTMKLEGWRGFIANESAKDQTSEKIDIKLCPTRMSEELDVGLPRNHSAALTEEEDDGHDAHAGAVEYVSVSTPRSTDNSVARAV